jgi:hypothetical protein
MAEQWFSVAWTVVNSSARDEALSFVPSGAEVVNAIIIYNFD